MDIALAIIITFVLTSIGCVLLTRSYFLNRRKEEDKQVHKMLEHVATKQNESQLILASLNMGVIAYSHDGILLLSNQAASKILSEIPHNFHDFIELYDQKQKLRSDLILEKKQSEIILNIKEKTYRLTVEERVLGKSKRPAHIILIQDITEQVLEDQQRKEFVANVSHELKTPLTTIKTYSESLLDWGIDEKSRAAVKKDMEKLYTGSIRMEQLIDDLLLLSRIDGKAIFTHIEKRKLMPIIRTCIERMYPQADQKNIDISSYSLSDPIYAFVDVSAFERIIMNLVSNAIKYTLKYGEVKVYVGTLVEDIYIKIVDNGIGIPKDAQKNIFKRFYRVDSTGSRAHGGTGLGLSIVKELVELHSGQIDLKSHLDQGSEFTIILPSVKKVLRNTLYELIENGHALSVITKAAEEELVELAKSLKIVAQWKSLQQNEINLIIREIELNY